MTNAAIIFNEQLRLMENGILKSTGNQLEIEMPDGTKKSIDEPMPIHTFATWKKLGYQVKRGEKAIAKFPIWKYVVNKSDKENTVTVDEEPESRMFMKISAFFSAEQVEPLKVKA